MSIGPLKNIRGFLQTYLSTSATQQPRRPGQDLPGRPPSMSRPPVSEVLPCNEPAPAARQAATEFEVDGQRYRHMPDDRGDKILAPDGQLHDGTRQGSVVKWLDDKGQYHAFDLATRQHGHSAAPNFTLGERPVLAGSQAPRGLERSAFSWTDASGKTVTVHEDDKGDRVVGPDGQLHDAHWNHQTGDITYLDSSGTYHTVSQNTGKSTSSKVAPEEYARVYGQSSTQPPPASGRVSPPPAYPSPPPQPPPSAAPQPQRPPPASGSVSPPPSQPATPPKQPSPAPVPEAPQPQRPSPAEFQVGGQRYQVVPDDQGDLVIAPDGQLHNGKRDGEVVRWLDDKGQYHAYDLTRKAHTSGTTPTFDVGNRPVLAASTPPAELAASYPEYSWTDKQGKRWTVREDDKGDRVFAPGNTEVHNAHWDHAKKRVYYRDGAGLYHTVDQTTGQVTTSSVAPAEYQAVYGR